MQTNRMKKWKLTIASNGLNCPTRIIYVRLNNDYKRQKIKHAGALRNFVSNASLDSGNSK